MRSNHAKSTPEVEYLTLKFANLYDKNSWKSTKLLKHLTITECPSVNDAIEFLLCNFFDNHFLERQNAFSIYFQITERFQADKLEASNLDFKFKDNKIVIGFESSGDCCVFWKLQAEENLLRLKNDKKESFKFICEEVRKNVEDNKSGE